MYFLSMEWFAHLNELPQILQAEYIGDCEIRTIRLKTMATKPKSQWIWEDPVLLMQWMSVLITNETCNIAAKNVMVFN